MECTPGRMAGGIEEKPRLRNQKTYVLAVTVVASDKLLDLCVSIPVSQNENTKCTGMTQWVVGGWEVGGGFMFGIACTPVVDSCQCMAKPIQYCKVK